jgi:hypothetical protein
MESGAIESGAYILNSNVNSTIITNPESVNITGGHTQLVGSGGSGFIGGISVIADTVNIHESVFNPGEVQLTSGQDINVYGGTNFGYSIISGDITVISGVSTIASYSQQPLVTDSIVSVIGGFNQVTGVISGITYGTNTIYGDVPYVLSGITHIYQTKTGTNIVYVTGTSTSILGSGTTHILNSNVDIFGGYNVLTGENFVFQSGAEALIDLESGTANVYDNTQVNITGLASVFNVYGQNQEVNITGQNFISGNISGELINITSFGNVENVEAQTLTIINAQPSGGATAFNIVTVPSGSFTFGDIASPVISGSSVMATGETFYIYGGENYFTGMVTGVINAEIAHLTVLPDSETEIHNSDVIIYNSGAITVGDEPTIIQGTIYHTGTITSVDRFSTITAYDQTQIHCTSNNTITSISGYVSITGTLNSTETVNSYGGIVTVIMQTGKDAVVTSHDTSTVNLTSGLSGANCFMYDDSELHILSGNQNTISQGSGWTNPVNIRLSTNYIWSTGVTTQAGANVIYSPYVDITHGYNYFYDFDGEAEISGFQNYFFDSICHGISGFINQFYNSTNYVQVGTRHINDTFYTTVYETHYTQIPRTGNFYTITHSTGVIITGTGDIFIQDYSSNPVYQTIVEKSGYFIDHHSGDINATGDIEINDYRLTAYYPQNFYNFFDNTGDLYQVTGYNVDFNGVTDSTIESYQVRNNTNQYSTITVYGNDNIVTGSGETTIHDYSQNTTNITFAEKTGYFIEVNGNDNIVIGSGVTSITDYSTHATHSPRVEKSGTFITIAEVTNIDELIITGTGDIFVYEGAYVERSGVFIDVSGNNNVVTGSGQTTINDYSSSYSYDQRTIIDKTGTWIDIAGTGITLVGLSGIASGGTGYVTIYDYSSNYNYDQRVLVDRSGAFITVSGSDNTVVGLSGIESGGTGYVTIHDYTTTIVDKSKTITIDLVSGYPSGIFFNTIDKSGTFLVGTGQTVIVTGSGHNIYDYSHTTVYPDSTIIQLISGFPTGVFRYDYNLFYIDISGGTTAFSGISGLINISGDSTNYIHDAMDIDIYNPGLVTISGGFNQFTGALVQIFDSEDYFAVNDGGICNIVSSDILIGNSGGNIYITSDSEGDTVINVDSGTSGIINVSGYVWINDGVNHISGSLVHITGGTNYVSGNEEVNITGEVAIFGSDLINIINPSAPLHISGVEQINIDATSGYGISLEASYSDIDIISGTTYISGANPVSISGGTSNLTGCIVTAYHSGGNDRINIHDSVVTFTGHEVHISGGVNTATGHFVDITDSTNYVWISGGETNIIEGINVVDVQEINAVTGGLNTFNIYESGNIHIHSGVNTIINATGNDSVRVDFHLSGMHNTPITTTISNTVTDSGHGNFYITQEITGAVLGHSSALTQYGIHTLNSTNGNFHFTGLHYGQKVELPNVTSIGNDVSITSSSTFINSATHSDANAIWNLDGPIVESGAILSGQLHHSDDSVINAVYGINTLTNTVTAPVTATTVFVGDNIAEAGSNIVINSGNTIVSGHYIEAGGHLGISGTGITIYSGVTINNVFSGTTNIYSGFTVHNYITGDSPFATGTFNISQGVNNLTASYSHFTSDNVTQANVSGSTLFLEYYSGSSGQNFINTSAVIINSGITYITGGTVTVKESINDIRVTIEPNATESLILTESTNYIRDSIIRITGTAYITGGVNTNYISGQDTNTYIYGASGHTTTIHNFDNGFANVYNNHPDPLVTGIIVTGTGNTVNIYEGARNTLIHNYEGGVSNLTGADNVLFDSISGEYNIYGSDVTINNAEDKIGISGDFGALNITTGYFENFTGTITTLNITGYINNLDVQDDIGSIHHTGNIGSFDIDLSNCTVGTINLVSDLDIADQVITGSGHTVTNSSHADIQHFVITDSDITRIQFGSGTVNILNSGAGEYTTIQNIVVTGSGEFKIDYFTGSLDYSAGGGDIAVGDQTASAYYGSATNNVIDGDNQGSHSLEITDFTGVASIDLSRIQTVGNQSISATTSYYGGSVSASASADQSNTDSPTNVTMTNYGEIDIKADFSMGATQSWSVGYNSSSNPSLTQSASYHIGITGAPGSVVNITGSHISGRLDNNTINITGGQSSFFGREDRKAFTHFNDIDVFDSDVLIQDCDVTLSGVQPMLYVSGGTNDIHADGIHWDIHPEYYVEAGNTIHLVVTGTGNSGVINIISGTVYNITNSGGIIENITISGGFNNLSGDNLTISTAHVQNAVYLNNTEVNNVNNTFENVDTVNYTIISGTLRPQTNNIFITGSYPSIGSIVSGIVSFTGNTFSRIDITGGFNTFYVNTGQHFGITGGVNTINGGEATIIGNIDTLTLQDSLNYVSGVNVDIVGGTNYVTGQNVDITAGNNYFIPHISGGTITVDNLIADGGVFHFSGNTGIHITGRDFTVNISGWDHSIVNITGQGTFSITGTTYIQGNQEEIYINDSTNNFLGSTTGVYITGGNTTMDLEDSEVFIDQSNSYDLTNSVLTYYNNLQNTINGGVVNITGAAVIDAVYSNLGTSYLDFNAATGFYVIVSGGTSTLNYATGTTIFDCDTTINDSEVNISGDIENIAISGGVNQVSGINVTINDGSVLLGVHAGDETDVIINNSDVTVSGLSYISGDVISVTNNNGGITNIIEHDDQINVYYNPNNSTGAMLNVTSNTGSFVNIYQFRNLDHHTGSFVDVNRIGTTFGDQSYDLDSSFSNYQVSYGYQGTTSFSNSNDIESHISNTGYVYVDSGNIFTTYVTSGIANIHVGPHADLQQSNNSINGGGTIDYTNNLDWDTTINSDITVDTSNVTLTGNYDVTLNAGNTINYNINDQPLILTNPTGFINGTISEMLFSGQQLNVTGHVTITNGSNITTNNVTHGHNTDSNVSIIDTNIYESVNVYGGLTQVHGTNPVTFNLVTGRQIANTVMDVGDPSHILEQGDVIQYNGITSGYTKAIADSITGTENVVGVVVETSGGGFKFVSHGETPFASVSGFNYGKPLYLSDTTHGLLTTDKPTANRSVIKRIGTSLNRKVLVNVGDDELISYPENTGANAIIPEFFGSPVTNNSENHYSDFLGAATIFTTKEIDLTQAYTHTIHFTPGHRFFCDEFGLVITDSSVSPVLHGPRYKIGITGDDTNISNLYTVPAIDDKIYTHERIRLGSPNDTMGVNNIITEITSGATAGTLHGKFYFKGFVLQEELE